MVKKMLTNQEKTMQLLNLKTGAVDKERPRLKEIAKANRFADVTHQIGSNGLFLSHFGSRVLKTRTKSKIGESLYLFDRKKLNSLCKNV